MKVNYQLELEKILNGLEGRPSLLLHACCGICSSYVLEYLTNYFDITVLYYNPNIYPLEEYNKRFDTLKELVYKSGNKVKVMEIGYASSVFYDRVKGMEEEKEGGKRCVVCYYMRLEKTADLAKKMGFDYFCTTLSISPYKDAQKLNKIGKILAEKYGVNYLYSDFKKKDGYKRSNEIAREYGLYRQDYCGCEYSMGHLTVK